MHSSPRSSKPKSKPPPPKKAKRDGECNSCEGSNVVLEEEEEKEKEVGAGGSEGVLPETVVGNVKNSDSRPLGSGEEDNEPMDTSEGGGDGGGDRGEEEEGKKEDSSSQVVKKKDNSGIGTTEPTKKKKQAHPFFGNAEACLIFDSLLVVYNHTPPISCGSEVEITCGHGQFACI